MGPAEAQVLHHQPAVRGRLHAQGQTRSCLGTRMDDGMLTVDGNNPLCGREVVFTLEILTVRAATGEEMKAGGAIDAGADVDPSLMRPV